VYPKGYAAQVQGGSITSAKGARVLQVTACKGVPEVAVTVTRAGRTTATCKPPPLVVKVRPKRVKAGKRVRLTVTVRPAVKGAAVRVGGRRARTNAKGVARLRMRFAKPHEVAVSVRSGKRHGRAQLRVTR
jgi:hypothetical protein